MYFLGKMKLNAYFCTVTSPRTRLRLVHFGVFGVPYFVLKHVENDRVILHY